MQKSYFTLIFLILVSTQMLKAQMPGGGGFDPSKMNIGRFYGKIVDDNGRGVAYATVQLYGKKFDFNTKTLKDTLWAGQFTEDNGDFNLEKLPVVGDFNLKISFLGYGEIEKIVTFGIKPPPMPSEVGRPNTSNPPKSGKPEDGKSNPKPEGKTNIGNGFPTNGMPQSGGGFGGGGFSTGNFEKDLGNIRLTEDSKMLKEAVVTDQANTATLSLDRKSYRVDKDITAAGGTAQDALKNVPTLSVDLDGNVSLRNGAPQIFVDGRPSTLSLDQISADAIESVEVITNPSAKYDAGGGTAGIVNIVLKKEKRLGYNGNVRTGVDSRGGGSFGGDINARGGKINLFGGLNLNYNKNFGDGESVRHNLFGIPNSDVTQTTHNNMQGLFANGRAGIDFLLDNRNTLTVSTNYTRGKFNPSDIITTETDFFEPSGARKSIYIRTSDQDRNFRNAGGTVQFKHLFPKKGAEWTADANFNRVRFKGGSDYVTSFDNGFKSKENQAAIGRSQYATFQSDFVNPISEKTKIDGGIRATGRFNRNDNANTRFDPLINDWVSVKQISDHYKFQDMVFAAYSQMSHQRGKWGIQVGLRAESSLYRGALTDVDSSFAIIYPISLFPSVFFTRKINESDNVQLAYSRRVNRPNFFQNLPFTDFTDSLNLRRGNPGLLPEFTNNIELTYQNIFSKGHNLLVSLYLKQASDLITTYQFKEFNTVVGKEVIVTSFANSKFASAIGSELTIKNTFFKWLDLTTNLNVYQSQLNADNVEISLKINRLSAFLKETVQMKLPKKVTFQLNGEYRTKASFTPSNNNDPFRSGPPGGGPGGPPAQNSAQGYSLANYSIDASIRKEMWKNKATLSLSMQDVFATRRMGLYTATDFFNQSSYRVMAPQTVRLNFSYRFGKMDTSLFSRKNNKVNAQGNDMM
jgi:outer membrane receptor protein involved in Fe transport